MDPVIQMVLIVAALFLLGAFAELIFARTGIPDMIWLVAAGIVSGPVFKLVAPKLLMPVLPFFGAIALITILMGGGLKFRIADVAAAAPRAIILGLVGFVTSIFAICLSGIALMEFFYDRPAPPLVAWVMVGAIVGGTSSLVIIPAMAGGKTDSRVARILEVESCITDALCVVVTLVVIDIILRGTFDITYPALALAKAAGIGIGLGVAGAVVLIPLLPMLRGRVHSYTILLAGFLLVHGLVQLVGGNGAIGVLTYALLIGNASDLLPKLHRRAHAEEYAVDINTMTIHAQLSFFVKSFFFFLIGVLFPTSLEQILIGIGAAVALLIARVPAVGLSLWRSSFTPAQKGLMTLAIPRGLAAGVLSTMPMYKGVPNAADLVPVVFATIVFSILIFSAGLALLGRRAQA